MGMPQLCVGNQAYLHDWDVTSCCRKYKYEFNYDIFATKCKNKSINTILNSIVQNKNLTPRQRAFLHSSKQWYTQMYVYKLIFHILYLFLPISRISRYPVVNHYLKLINFHVWPRFFYKSSPRQPSKSLPHQSRSFFTKFTSKQPTYHGLRDIWKLGVEICLLFLQLL